MLPGRQLHSLSSIAFRHTHRGASRAQIPFTHPSRPAVPSAHATRFHPQVNLSHADLHDIRRHLLSLPGHQQPAFVQALLARSMDIARATPEVFTTPPAATALPQAHGVPRWQDTPLSGLPVTVKDLFDVEGEVTTAGSRVLGPEGVGRAPAHRDAPAVARLRAAGATLFGRTNMSEFAFSGVGVNPHFGTPPNPADARVPRIPGGSTSGGAVSVANGCAWVALGSDTGGSLRIPAALCGVVGFKSTARLVSGRGAFPLATSLDTVGAITRSVRDAALAHQILSGRPAARSTTPTARLRLAVVRGLLLQDLDDTVSQAYARALSVLSAAGAQLVEIELPELEEVAAQAAALGTFPAAESHALHRGWLDAHSALYDPGYWAGYAAVAPCWPPTTWTLWRGGRTGSAVSVHSCKGSMRWCLPPSPWLPHRWRRWRPARSVTTRSSAPMACCCAIPPPSICWMAARCRCPATSPSPVSFP